jgi:uncharacterized OB-fold protein
MYRQIYIPIGNIPILKVMTIDIYTLWYNTITMAKIKIDGYKCERCGHIWFPREYTKEEPKVCPRCKSPYWNRPRKKN